MVHDKNRSTMLAAQAAFCGRQDFAALCRSYENEQQNTCSRSPSNSPTQDSPSYSCFRTWGAARGMETNRCVSEAGRAYDPEVGASRTIPGSQADAPEVGQRPRI